MNSKVISAFYSITTAFFLFVALAVVFGLGSHLAGLEHINPIFKKMTAIHVWSCVDSILDNWVLLLWLSILIIVAIALFINTLCCTSQLLKSCFSNRPSSIKYKQYRMRMMTVIHVIALAVIVCHALDITLVQRHKPVKIIESEKATFGNYEIRIINIAYQTDRKFIQMDENGKQMPSFKIPRKQFSIEGNSAQIAVYHEGKLLKEGEIRLFDPFRVGSSFFILDGFYLPYNSDKIGVSIHHTYNPLALPFFAIYTLLFSALLYQYFSNRYRPEKPHSTFIKNTTGQ